MSFHGPFSDQPQGLEPTRGEDLVMSASEEKSAALKNEVNSAPWFRQAKLAGKNGSIARRNKGFRASNDTLAEEGSQRRARPSGCHRMDAAFPRRDGGPMTNWLIPNGACIRRSAQGRPYVGGVPISDALKLFWHGSASPR